MKYANFPCALFSCPVWLCTCAASQFELATVKYPTAILEKSKFWYQNTQLFKIGYWSLNSCWNTFSEMKYQGTLGSRSLSLIWKSSTRYHWEICKDYDWYWYVCNNIKEQPIGTWLAFLPFNSREGETSPNPSLSQSGKQFPLFQWRKEFLSSATAS